MQDNSNTAKVHPEFTTLHESSPFSFNKPQQLMYGQPQSMMYCDIGAGYWSDRGEKRTLKLDGYEGFIEVSLLDIVDGVAIIDANIPCAYIHQCSSHDGAPAPSSIPAGNNVQVSSLILELVTSHNKLVVFEDDVLKLFCCTKLTAHNVIASSNKSTSAHITYGDAALKVAFVTRKAIVGNNRLIRSGETLKARLQNLVQKAKKVIK